MTVPIWVWRVTDQPFTTTQSTDTFGEITDLDFPGALTISYLNGYFVFIEPNSQKVWTAELLDPTSIDPLAFASAEGSPDGLVSSITDHSEVWLFGTNSVEVWYNSGAVDFPLQRIQGAFNEIGCAATFSVAKLDNGLFWLGQMPVVVVLFTVLMAIPAHASAPTQSSGRFSNTATSRMRLPTHTSKTVTPFMC
jgi:hypothetical protein